MMKQTWIQDALVTPRHHRRHAGGFTLVEILIAFGIFAIGMIAIASLFPVAALLQRETASEVVGEHAAESARAIVEAKGLSYAVPANRPGSPSLPAGSTGVRGELDNYHPNDGSRRTSVMPLHRMFPVATTANLIIGKFSIGDRSYPSAAPTLADRGLFWVPFVRDLNGDPTNPDFVLSLFVLEPDSRARYPNSPSVLPVLSAANAFDNEVVPKVVPIGCSVVDSTTFALSGYNPNNASLRIQGGDRIMDSNGTDYTVAEVNGTQITIVGRILLSPEAPDTIWYAPPYGGTSSPTQRIVTLKISHQSLTP